MGNDPLAAYRRERSQRNNMGLEQPQEPLTEHQALELAIDALNQIPNRSLTGEYSTSYKLIPVLNQAYEKGRETEKLTEAAPDMYAGLDLMIQVYENIVSAADNGQPYSLEELLSKSFTVDVEKAREAYAKATPEPTSTEKTREIDMELER